MKSAIVFLLILTADMAVAQSKWCAFFRLSGPEKTWTLLHPFTAGRAWKITRESRDQVQQQQHHTGLDTFHHGGRLDAFRHAYWMARLTQEIGAGKARQLGKAHEKGNYRRFKRNKGEDGVIQDSTATVMDLQNNEAGIGIGVENPQSSSEQLAGMIIEKIKSGQLTILKRNTEGELCTCDSMTVSIPSGRRRSWALPFCLIPSNQ